MGRGGPLGGRRYEAGGGSSFPRTRQEGCIGRGVYEHRRGLEGASKARERAGSCV